MEWVLDHKDSNNIISYRKIIKESKTGSKTEKVEWVEPGKDLRVPIKSWCKQIEATALDQMKNICRLPFIYMWGVLSADAHQGYGFPIGGIAATLNVLFPYGVGSDGGCGMIAVQTDYKAEDITPELIDRIMEETAYVIPHGKGIGHTHPQSWDGYAEAPEFPTYIKSALEESRYQLGTLGSGNHFIEMLKGEDGFIWLMIHSGSRNLGYQICNEFHHQAKHLMDIYHIELPDPNLAYLPVETKEGKAYLDMMNFALKFAFENRRRMMNVFQSITCGMLGCSIQQEINIHHNYAAFERHFGKDVIVHRKGATSARKDQLGIIPGSMGTPSYIVRGLGNRESFESCSHGAGRVLGRNKAKKQLNKDTVEKFMTGIWTNKLPLDEAPQAYKNIDQVIADQADLIEPVVKLYPIGVIVG